MLSAEKAPSAFSKVIGSPTSSSTRSTPVDVFLTAGHGLVWDAESARILREKRGIIGAMGGTLVQFRQQNVAKGLPLILSPEDIRLALHNGWITLFDGGQEALNPQLQARIVGSKSTPDAGENMQQNTFENSRCRSSVEACLPFQHNKHRGQDLQGVTCEDPESSTQKSDPEVANGNLSLGSLVSEIHMLQISGPVNGGPDLTLPAVTSELHPRRDPSSTIYTEKLLVPLAGGLSLQSAHPLLPTGKRALMSAVMSDLHTRGYRVSDGTKFGADYLAYPGDPSEFHSQYAVRVVEDQELIYPIETLGGSRVALGARKRFVIASGARNHESFFEDSCHGSETASIPSFADVAQGGAAMEGRDCVGYEVGFSALVSSSSSSSSSSSHFIAFAEHFCQRIASHKTRVDAISLIRVGFGLGGSAQGLESESGGAAGESLAGDIEYITLATDLDFVPRKMKAARAKKGQGRGGRGRGGAEGRGGRGEGRDGGANGGESEREEKGLFDTLSACFKSVQ